MSSQAVQSTQVAIIGAGPTGLSMAVQLMRYNISFIILEKNETTTAFSKALIVQARTLEIFQEIGLSRKAIDTGKITTALNIFSKGKAKAAIDLAGLGEGISEFSFALSLEQSKTEKLLSDHLSANGIDVQWQCTFSKVEEGVDVSKVYYSDAAGISRCIECNYIIGCDGASSLLRHQLGLSFEGDTVPKKFYVTDVTISSPVICKNELYGFVIEKGFVFFFPMEGKGHYRIVGIVPGEASADKDFNFQEIETMVQQFIVVPVTFKEVRWVSTYKVHSRKADSFRKGNCFIAGDAAHIHTPAGGQGMNTGIQDAYNLAWKIALVLRNNADKGILETYNTERMENARHLLRTTDRMFDIMAGTNILWNFIRLKIFPVLMKYVSGRQRFNRLLFPLISQTGISYHSSALTCKSRIGEVQAGDRMHYFTFSDGSSIFEHLTFPGFKILYFGNNDNNRFDFLKNITLPYVTMCFNEIPVKIFGTDSGFYILLRPDNHISYIGKNETLLYQLLRKLTD